MLRSIFSLIHNIIECDRDYKKKSKCRSSADDYKEDLEIRGKYRNFNQMIRKCNKEEMEESNDFKLSSGQGNSSSLKRADMEKRITKYNEELDDIPGDKFTFSNEEYKDDTYDAEIQGEAGVNVRELLAKLPATKVTPPEKDKEQVGALLEQIQKMKKGMEQLHQIAKQFTCSHKFKQDVDYLIKHLSVDKSQSKPKNIQNSRP